MSLKYSPSSIYTRILRNSIQQSLPDNYRRVQFEDGTAQISTRFDDFLVQENFSLLLSRAEWNVLSVFFDEIGANWFAFPRADFIDGFPIIRLKRTPSGITFVSGAGNYIRLPLVIEYLKNKARSQWYTTALGETHIDEALLLRAVGTDAYSVLPDVNIDGSLNSNSSEKFRLGSTFENAITENNPISFEQLNVTVANGIATFPDDDTTLAYIRTTEDITLKAGESVLGICDATAATDLSFPNVMNFRANDYTSGRAQLSISDAGVLLWNGSTQRVIAFLSQAAPQNNERKYGLLVTKKLTAGYDFRGFFINNDSNGAGISTTQYTNSHTNSAGQAAVGDSARFIFGGGGGSGSAGEFYSAVDSWDGTMRNMRFFRFYANPSDSDVFGLMNGTNSDFSNNEIALNQIETDIWVFAFEANFSAFFDYILFANSNSILRITAQALSINAVDYNLNIADKHKIVCIISTAKLVIAVNNHIILDKANPTENEKELFRGNGTFSATPANNRPIEKLLIAKLKAFPTNATILEWSNAANSATSLYGLLQRR